MLFRSGHVTEGVGQILSAQGLAGGAQLVIALIAERGIVVVIQNSGALQPLAAVAHVSDPEPRAVRQRALDVDGELVCVRNLKVSVDEVELVPEKSVQAFAVAGGLRNQGERIGEQRRQRCAVGIAGDVD